MNKYKKIDEVYHYFLNTKPITVIYELPNYPLNIEDNLDIIQRLIRLDFNLDNKSVISAIMPLKTSYSYNLLYQLQKEIKC